MEKGDSITTEIRLKQGQSHTITGIPIGTDYEITEVKLKDGTTLKKVLISNDGTNFKDDTSFKRERLRKQPLQRMQKSCCRISK